MKMTAIEALELAELPFVLWLRIHTDAGLIGTGETFFAPQAVAACLHGGVAFYLLGKDPRDTELHDRTLDSVYNGTRDTGAEMRGTSVINVALWDIFGVAVGEPVGRLLLEGLTTMCPSTIPAPDRDMPAPQSRRRRSSETTTGTCRLTTRRRRTTTCSPGASTPTGWREASSPRASG